MKKSIILISLFLITTALAYSHSLGVGLYIPLGGSIPSLYQTDNLNPNLSLSPKSSFEVGVIFNPRVTLNIDKYNDISIGVDVGWYRDTFKFQTSSKNFTHEFDTVMTGINFRWSPSLFVLGIGGGVKFPFTGKYWEGNNNIALSAGNFSARFNNTVIPYIRLYTGIDVSLISLALYVNFDIPNMQIKDNLASLGEGYSYPGKLGSVDIGVQIGLHLDIFKFGENE
ncbi:hypothetical protein JQ824_03695 [Brachyspira hyodysenteriae]|uniref:Outer membrane protein beta-barrel domain-containing protein n=1 Tax=Brachyspira hyodysenteriae ATCC 27164 TaxID=1266923 RepID=A0A3B6VTD0_BRAHO|nr:hypothetical protein [Brachyspira hyodysenteriae]ANN62708.1 hypothetical protein BHYOB78_02195 [Brachyspira hyodysenteriae ATCC 27164]AUJ50983.1 hypothetical protein BH718_02555 [Brachyspira hyodysenteriae]KLI23121.1 hypothetical protein SZ47_11750 [Brachyspira hyodysenteriae]KLI26434.1 hypothetical protein SR30_04855 [Brachyspira hyodysenteriae]KLI31715.1 hypothetical protein SZ50_09825 [Brachyspira hyodysenteriae]